MSLGLFDRAAGESGATFSPCRRWRYHLWRVWGDPGKRCCFVSLNPSIADEVLNDATIRKCIGFAKRWQFGSYSMLNLFGWRSTDPLGLLTTPDPIGEGNRDTFVKVLGGATRVVLAWGSHDPKVRALVHGLVGGQTAQTPDGIVRSPLPWGLEVPVGVEVGTLGRNSDGSPRHPLMLAYTTPFEPLVWAPRY
jgi:hypothetical protein